MPKSGRNLLSLLTLLFAFVFVTGALCLAASSRPAQEQQKIDYLLKEVSSSKATFVRNGKEHNGPEARKHLEEKLDYAGDRIQTAEQFIDYVAKKSSITGRIYTVKEDGKEIKSADWLRNKLKGWHPQ